MAFDQSLLNQNFSSKKDNVFWLIFVAEKEVATALVDLSSGETRLIGLSDLKEWDGEKNEDLLVSLDAAIGDVLVDAGISDSKDLNRAVFVLPFFWLNSKGEVLETKMETLKVVSQKFDLDPRGFVVVDEAMTHFFKKQEGIPPSLVLVYLGSHSVSLSLIEVGSIRKRVRLENGDSFSPESLESSFGNLEADTPLPAEIMIWGKFPPTLEEAFLNHSWTSSSKSLFVHFPEIRTLHLNKVFQMVASVVASEVFDAVFKIPETDSPKKEIKPKEEESYFGGERAADFGFTEEDLERKAVLEHQKVPDNELAKEEAVVKDGEAAFEDRSIKKKESRKNISLAIISGGLNLFRKIKANNPLMGLKEKKFSFGKVKILIAIPILISIIFAAWWFLPKAEIAFIVTPKMLTENISVLLSDKVEAIDVNKKIIPARKISLDIQGEKELETTGKKLIGEKARGEVTIFNRLDLAKSFPKGTKLKNKNGLEFITLDEVRVASKTADLASGVDRWGEVKVEVEASGIGGDFNLAKDTLFTIADLPQSSFLVNNAESFTGGTSREVRAVDKNDRLNLKKALEEDLWNRFGESLKRESNEGEIILKDATDRQILEENYSREIDEEADFLVLKMKIKFSGFRADKDQIFKFLEEKFQDELGGGGYLKREDSEINFKMDKSEKEGILGELSFKGKIYPQIDLEKVKRDILGKRRAEAVTYFNKLPMVSRYQLKITPHFPEFIVTLPHLMKNIKMEIKE